MSSSYVVGKLSTTSQPRSFCKFVPIIWLLALLLAAGGAGASWFVNNKYEFFPKRFGVVVPGKLYRSGQMTPAMLEKMVKTHGITCIIDLQLNDINDVNQQAEVRYAAKHGLKHYRFGLGGDGTGDVGVYTDAVAKLIECVRQNQPALVHCAAGSQRTGGVVACYRLLIQHRDEQEVLRELRQYDWEPVEDQTLLDFLNANLPAIIVGLQERGVLTAAPVHIPHLGDN